MRRKRNSAASASRADPGRTMRVRRQGGALPYLPVGAPESRVSADVPKSRAVEEERLSVFPLLFWTGDNQGCNKPQQNDIVEQGQLAFRRAFTRVAFASVSVRHRWAMLRR